MAGGDIRVVYDSARAQDGSAEVLWREEYELIARIAQYPKPVVTIMDGITMGGGMGLGCHGPIRIATERSVLAMPEVSIGLAPDVAGTLLLARAPGHIGEHLALTASRMGAADAVYCGLVDHVVPSDSIGELARRLPAGASTAALAALAIPPGESRLAQEQAWIDECYGAGTVEEVICRLEAHEAPAAHAAAAQVRMMSPLSTKVTLRAMHETRRKEGIEDVLIQDFRVSNRFLQAPDLVEGIRAAVVDKDRRPRWSPAAVEQVTPAMVDRHFESLGEHDLRLAV